jgi:hypothetical protein
VWPSLRSRALCPQFTIRRLGPRKCGPFRFARPPVAFVSGGVCGVKVIGFEWKAKPSCAIPVSAATDLPGAFRTTPCVRIAPG